MRGASSSGMRPPHDMTHGAPPASNSHTWKPGAVLSLDASPEFSSIPCKGLGTFSTRLQHHAVPSASLVPAMSAWTCHLSKDNAAGTCN